MRDVSLGGLERVYGAGAVRARARYEALVRGFVEFSSICFVSCICHG